MDNRGAAAVVKFESWVDRQIREAIERGEFDNLPGAGKPLAGLDRRDDDWWIKQKLERENVTGVLPGSLALRKEVLEIDETVADVPTEVGVREVVADVNARVLDARRRGIDGPPIVVRTLDVEAVVANWRERRGH